MFWFGKPKISDVIAITDKWFRSIDGIQGDEVITVSFGRLTIHLCGSQKGFRQEFFLTHGEYPPENAYGIFHGSGSMGRPGEAQYHIYVPFKRDPEGTEYIAPWALQHELHHCIDNWLYLDGRDSSMSNPDTLD